MSKVICNKELCETLTISECTDGWWIYDKTRGMNLAMRAKTEQAAFVATITYYQNRLLVVEQLLKGLHGRVSDFVSEVVAHGDIELPD